MAVDLGFEKMILKNDVLKCFFVGNPESPYFHSSVFNGILSYLQKVTNKGQLKQVGKAGILVVDGIRSMTELYEYIKRMQEHVNKEFSPSRT